MQWTDSYRAPVVWGLLNCHHSLMLNVFVWSLATPWGLLVLSLASIHLGRHSSVLSIISGKHFLGFSQSPCFQFHWVQLLPSSSPLQAVWIVFALVSSGRSWDHSRATFLFETQVLNTMSWHLSVALAVSYELQCYISFLSYPMCFLFFSYCFCLWCNWNFYCLGVWSISCYLLIGFYSNGVMAREVVCLVLFTLHVLQLVVWCRL